MKILFEYEDCLYGIFLGVLLIGLSGTYFELPDIPMLWAAFFAIAVVLTILDVRHTFSDLSGHKLLIVAALVNNIVDFILEIAMTAYLFGVDIPYISENLNQYLADPTMLVGIGTFFIVTSCLWIYEYHHSR